MCASSPKSSVLPSLAPSVFPVPHFCIHQWKNLVVHTWVQPSCPENSLKSLSGLIIGITSFVLHLLTIMKLPSMSFSVLTTVVSPFFLQVCCFCLSQEANHDHFYFILNGSRISVILILNFKLC